MKVCMFPNTRALVAYVAWLALGIAAAVSLAGRMDVALEPALFGAVAMALNFALSLLSTKSYQLQSRVDGFAGACVPVWLNANQVLLHFDGAATGFFRRVRKVPGLPLYVPQGPEFHGAIVDGQVLSTEGYNSVRDLLNVVGTTTGRFRSDQVHECNTPKCA